MPQRNRDKIMQQSLYDLLCWMNDNINHDEVCIMDTLKAYTGARCAKYSSGKCCNQCIADYLNEEYPF